MKLKKSDQQQLWAEAQRRCRLSDEAVRMAKELGMGPGSLIKNIPAPTQQWKAPVEDWVRDLYERRQHKALRKKPSVTGGGAPAAGSRQGTVTLLEGAARSLAAGGTSTRSSRQRTAPSVGVSGTAAHLIVPRRGSRPASA